MKLLLTAIILSLALPCFVSAQSSLISLEGEIFDWGRVEPETLARMIRLYNRGDDSVMISGVETTCGCTNAPLSRHRLGPGDTVLMPVTINVNGFAGSIEKHITIYTSTPIPDTLQFVFKAYILHDVAVRQRNFSGVNDAVVGREITMTAEAQVFIDEPVTLYPQEQIIDSAMLVRVNIDHPVTIQPGGHLTIEARVTPLRPGAFSGNVSLPTNGKRDPVLTIPFSYVASLPQSK